MSAKKLSNNSVEPLWFCNSDSGLRRYRCLTKSQFGKRQVQRLASDDFEAPSEYCTPARQADPCNITVPAGFTLHRQDWTCVNQSIIEVTCPASVNCSKARGYLMKTNAPPPGEAFPDFPGSPKYPDQQNACSYGPLNLTTYEADKKQWILNAAFTVIPSPSHMDLYYAEPFGFNLVFTGNTIWVNSPTYGRIHTFTRSSSDGLWSTTPSAEWTYTAGPDQMSWLFPMIGMGSWGFIVGSHKGLHPGGTGPAHDAWVALGANKALIFPRSADGSWGTQTNITLDWASYTPLAFGFGCSVDISGNWAIVGAKESKYVFLFERSAGNWGTTAAVTINGFTGVTGFGENVAIDDYGGTALVGIPSSGQVYVFHRLAGTWDVTTVQRLDDAHTASYDFPGQMKIHGDYIAIAALAQEVIFIFERSGVTWSRVAELNSNKEFAGVGMGFATTFSFALEDRGSGVAAIVVGAWKAKKAFLLLRSGPGTYDVHELGTGSNFSSDVQVGSPSTQADNSFDGFGRSVGVEGDTIVVSSDSKRIFLYMQQLTNTESRSNASSFSVVSGSRYKMEVDTSRLIVDEEYTLCMDFDDEDGYRDVGLRGIWFKHGRRLRDAEKCSGLGLDVCVL